MKYAILPLLFLVSCGNPLSSSKVTPLRFADESTIAAEAQLKLITKEADRKKWLAQKNAAMAEINKEANETFLEISDIVQSKCFSCHDSNTKLPIYGRIFKKINPVTKHQVEGLKSLDFAGGFPFKAPGNPPQISILKSIRNAVSERTMPIKAYTLVYPHKKITDEDEKKILDWIDPVVEKLSAFELLYNSGDNSPAGQAKKVLELKCFRCHASGNTKGDFGNMEKMDELLKGKFVNLEQPDQSKLYNLMAKGKMPPNKLEALSVDELNTVRDWLEAEAKKLKSRP